MIHPHLLAQIFNRPHMMTPELMALAAEFGRARLLGEAAPDLVVQRYEPDDAEDEDDDGMSGVAVIPIAGPLVPRTGNLKFCKQMTAYETVAARLDAALADPDIAHIAFDIDSPGGASTGAFELADRIRAAGQIKPTSAIVNFNAFSGAYLLAAACNEISLSQSGGVGSIGVIAQHMDVSKMNEAMGVRITAVYRGDKKNNLTPNEPLSDASLAQLNDMVERTYGQFVDAVAGFRSMPRAQVVDTQAGLYFGQDAIDAGLADRVETAQQAIDRIAAGVAAARQQRQGILVRAGAMNMRARM